jgi:hypothetical protein
MRQYVNAFDLIRLVAAADAEAACSNDRGAFSGWRFTSSSNHHASTKLTRFNQSRNS